MLRLRQLLLILGLATTGTSTISSSICAACGAAAGMIHTCQALKGIVVGAEAGVHAAKGAANAAKGAAHAAEGAAPVVIHAGEDIASGVKDAAVWTGRHAASLAATAWKDLLKTAKWITHDTPWNNRWKQIQISIVNQTNNKILEIRQLGRTGTQKDEPIYFKCGEVGMGAVTSVESRGADTEAHSGDVLMSAVASENIKEPTGVAGGATITVKEKGKPTFYMNIAFAHEITTSNKFSVNLTGSAISKQTSKRRCNSLFWSNNTRNTTDWISLPYKMGGEWFVVKAILRPTADDLMYDGVHYVYAIEQVEEPIGEGDLGDDTSQEPGPEAWF